MVQETRSYIAPSLGNCDRVFRDGGKGLRQTGHVLRIVSGDEAVVEFVVHLVEMAQLADPSSQDRLVMNFDRVKTEVLSHGE